MDHLLDPQDRAALVILALLLASLLIRHIVRKLRSRRGSGGSKDGDRHRL